MQCSAGRRSEIVNGVSVCPAVVPGSVFISAVLPSSYVVGRKSQFRPV